MQKNPFSPRTSFFSLLLVFLLGAAACQPLEDVHQEGGGVMSITITSSAFSEGERIPLKHTCDDQDFSPPLSWSGVPQETQSLVMIVDDPDAPLGTWVHWVLYDIPPDLAGLPEDIAKVPQVPGIGTQGKNDFRRFGYGGPCPPPGKPHRYFFKLYALDTTLNLEPGATKAQVETAMQGHILAQGQLVGFYVR